MGRAQQKSPVLRRLAVVAAVAAGLGLAVAGCSAGQITQTDAQVAAVNGASGTVGAIAVRDAQLLFPVAEGHYREGDDAPVVVVIANNGTEVDTLVSVTAEGTEGSAEVAGDADLEPGTAIKSGADQDDAGSHPTSGTKPSSSAPHGSVTTTPSSGSSGSSVTTTTTPVSPTSASAPSGTSGSSVAPTSTSVKVSVSVSAEPSEPGKAKITLKGLTKDLRPGQTLRVTFVFKSAGQLTLDVPIGASPEPRKDAPAEH